LGGFFIICSDVPLSSDRYSLSDYIINKLNQESDSIAEALCSYILFSLSLDKNPEQNLNLTK